MITEHISVIDCVEFSSDYNNGSLLINRSAVKCYFTDLKISTRSAISVLVVYKKVAGTD